MALKPLRRVRPRLSAAAASILGEELEHACYLAGKRLLELYLEDLAASRVLESVNDPARVRQIVEEALTAKTAAAANSPSLLKLASTRYFPKTKTRDMLAILDAAVRTHPDLSGMTLAECAQVIEEKDGTKLQPESIHQLIRRNTEFHVLAVRRGKVRLQSDLLVQVLGGRHSQIKLSEAPKIKRRDMDERPAKRSM
jgi:hypothetical protein